MRLYQTKKRILSLKNDPEPFLNGITSNVLDAPRNAFLTIHGKIVATFDQLKVSDNEFWIIMEPSVIDMVREHISRFALLAKVAVENIQHHVYFDLDGDFPLGADEKTIPQKKGRLIISAMEKSANVTEDEFLAFRVENGIAQQGMDYHDDFILNVSETEFVSYTKGCYLGQEPVSKVHHRSKPTWRLIVKAASDCLEDEIKKMTSAVEHGTTGELRGFVFERNN